MWILLLLPVALADDPPPSPAPTAPEAAQAETAPAETAPAETSEPAQGFDELDVVHHDFAVQHARAELFEVLTAEGYRKGEHKNDRTVFASRTPWKPKVTVHDDGWVYVQRQPPRIHAPGRAFADQGRPTEYLWCLLAPTACISVGGWLVSDRKLGAAKQEVLDATAEKVRAMNDAVARRELGRRLYDEIPADLERIWAQTALAPAHRRALLYEYWDSRTETPEGEQAKDAIEAFLRGVVQSSDTPYTTEELAALNARRSTARALSLD